MADRYTYISSIGFFFMIAMAAKKLKPAYMKVVISFFLIYAVFLSVQARERSRIWRDSLTLWNDQAEKYPDDQLAFKNRGLVKGFLGDYHGAVEDFNRVLSIDSVYAPAYCDRGM